MKDPTERIVFGFYGVFGAVIGFLIFVTACDGWSFVFTGRATRTWNGGVALIIFCLLGAGWGLVSYKFRNREFGARGSMVMNDSGTPLLFAKRLMVIATSLAALYFIWQLGRGV